MNEPDSVLWEELAAELAGRSIRDVEVVHDYVQLHVANGGVLNVHCPFRVLRKGEGSQPNLQDLRGATISGLVRSTPTLLEIQFGRGLSIFLELDKLPDELPEAVDIHLPLEDGGSFCFIIPPDGKL